MIKRIHVNKNVIASNRKHGKNDPPLTVKTYMNREVKTAMKNEYGHEISILSPSKMVYSPDKPLSCGARLWIETEGEVEIR